MTNKDKTRLNSICQLALNRKPVRVLDLPKIFRKAEENAHYNNDILFDIVSEYIDTLTVKA